MTLCSKDQYCSQLAKLPVLVYKFVLPKYDINNTRFVGLEVCAIGK
jgi:hypothetical protein